MIRHLSNGEDMNGAAVPNRWEEHQQRQRSIRILLMILMFLILIDDEDPSKQRSNLRHRKPNTIPKLDASVWKQRRDMDVLIGNYSSERKSKLIELNHGKDEAKIIQNFVLEELRENFSSESQNPSQQIEDIKHSHIDSLEDAKQLFIQVEEEDRLVYQYPRNATGLYRGHWKREPNAIQKDALSILSRQTNDSNTQIISREQVLSLVPDHYIGLQFLPRGSRLEGGPNLSNGTDTNNINIWSQRKNGETLSQLDATNDEGSLYIQLFSRSIPGMIEMSLIDGIVRFDGITDGGLFSLNKDLVFRVRGVIFHSLGKISLLGNYDEDTWRNILILRQPLESSTYERKLKDITSHIVRKYESLYTNDIVGSSEWDNYLSSDHRTDINSQNRKLQTNQDHDIISEQPPVRTIVEPYPFVAENAQTKYSLANPPSAVIRSTPELLLRKNGRSCEFVIDFNATERQSSFSELKTMMRELMLDLRLVDPNIGVENADDTRTTSLNHSRRKGSQSLVMNMIGNIRSDQCGFTASINVTALRRDMEKVTDKAVNYCFIMLVTCIVQAILLLRQMIYSQPQSSVIRVSIICIGWQTVLDALLSLEHLWLCFYIQPVATGFATIAFLKVMIFLAIELKYCVMIMKARLEAVGTNISRDEIKRKTSRMYLKFYVVLATATFALYRLKEQNYTVALLFGYSFWIPQIVLNAVNESRKPIHEKYLYGISFTRLIAPLYCYGVPNNFFQQMEPEFQTNFIRCELLILWIGLQCAILWGQSMYGARFMIPQRFLPPKFNYNRPIPSSLLSVSSVDRLKHIDDESDKMSLLENEPVLPVDLGGPRNRKMKTDVGKSSIQTIQNSSSDIATLDCVICCTDIDVRDRRGYMLAPCDHIFHKDCLTQWMEIKMECPVCRTDLPAI